MTQSQKILSLLMIHHSKTGGWVSMRELNKISFRYGDRIFTMRRKGIEIDKERRDNGEWFYRLAMPINRVDLENCCAKKEELPPPGEQIGIGI